MFNEELNIKALLTDILSQTKKYDTEIIVVSSGSSDKTDEIVKTFNDVKLLTESKRNGKASAVMLIFKEAMGEILIMTDGDVRFNKDLVDSVVWEFENHQIQALTGKVVPIAGSSGFFNKLANLGCEAWNNYRIDQLRKNDFVYPTGYLYAIKKRIYKGLILDRSIINDDAIIGYKIWKEGIQFFYSKKTIVHVLFPQNLKDFISQKTRTRMGRRQFEYKPFFEKVEKEWRNALLKTKFSYLYILTYYLLDFYCRMVLKLKMKKKEKSNIWKPIKSTKEISQKAFS